MVRQRSRAWPANPSTGRTSASPLRSDDVTQTDPQEPVIRPWPTRQATEPVTDGKVGTSWTENGVIVVQIHTEDCPYHMAH